jgi:hypothetical protein
VSSILIGANLPSLTYPSTFTFARLSSIRSFNSASSFNWFIAEQTVQKQQTARWGDGLIKQVSQDLQQEFPEIKGFSVRNLELILYSPFLIISDIYRPLS